MPMPTLREVYFCYMTDEEWAIYNNGTDEEKEAVYRTATDRFTNNHLAERESAE